LRVGRNICSRKVACSGVIVTSVDAPASADDSRESIDGEQKANMVESLMSEFPQGETE
jgi:hypothetical protein